MALIRGKFIDPTIPIKQNQDPATGNDVSRKSYVDAKAAAEAASAAAAAQSAAESYADGAAASAQSAAQSYADTKVSDEIAARQAADTTLQSSLNSEISQRQAGDISTLTSANSYTDTKFSSLPVPLLMGDGIASVIPVVSNIESTAQHYSGGVAHPLNPRYLCYFTDQTFVFVDARNPFASGIYKTLTFSTAGNNFPQTMTAVGNYVLVAMSNGRVYTLDWTDLQNPIIVGYKTIGSGQHFDMTTDGSNTLFLANASNNRVYVVDITDKTNPTLITSVSLGGLGTGVAYSGGYVYATNYSGTVHTIKKNATTGVWEQINSVASVATPTRAVVVQNKSGQSILVTQKYNGTDVIFYDLTNPAAPVELKRTTAPAATQIYCIPFVYENVVHFGLDDGKVAGYSIATKSDIKFAGLYIPKNSDGSAKFSSMRVIIRTSTKSPFLQQRELLLATGVNTGGTSSQKTTLPVELPIINYLDAEIISKASLTDLSQTLKVPHKEVKVLTSTDISNGYINVTRLAVAESTSINFGGAELMETDDYTVSTVGGVTRVTFSVATLALMAAGDKVYTKYWSLT